MHINILFFSKEKRIFNCLNHYGTFVMNTHDFVTFFKKMAFMKTLLISVLTL